MSCVMRLQCLRGSEPTSRTKLRPSRSDARRFVFAKAASAPRPFDPFALAGVCNVGGPPIDYVGANAAGGWVGGGCKIIYPCGSHPPVDSHFPCILPKGLDSDAVHNVKPHKSHKQDKCLRSANGTARVSTKYYLLTQQPKYLDSRETLLLTVICFLRVTTVNVISAH